MLLRERENGGGAAVAVAAEGRRNGNGDVRLRRGAAVHALPQLREQLHLDSSISSITSDVHQVSISELLGALMSYSPERN